ncbi:GNAT family N-acetyltransferase [Pectobacterium polaris]|uniref:GNAT family N-acetyltransferase n=1 Tax=Pectobacterium polaris TaxID=2042057 RepID=UPI0023B1FB8F|nr:GNAT family N-acetyltransferase [Pectobacterium polaris]MDE8757314.1 GNAT family N-acetyltransferase [Pectobacterium polaris]
MRLFSTERTDVYLLVTNLAEAFQHYLLNNRSHLAPFEPLRNEDYFQQDNISDRIINSLKDYENRKCLNLVFTLKNESKIIGSINFTNFIFGVFEACYLGFSLDHAHQGKGLMHESLNKSIIYVHEKYGMHRIMANHLPGNIRSSKTLGSLGFVKEGYAQSYLKINGVWQDHVLNSLVLP